MDLRDASASKKWMHFQTVKPDNSFINSRCRCSGKNQTALLHPPEIHGFQTSQLEVSFFKNPLAIEQARKPRSYASPKLCRLTDLMT